MPHWTFRGEISRTIRPAFRPGADRNICRLMWTFRLLCLGLTGRSSSSCTRTTLRIGCRRRKGLTSVRHIRRVIRMQSDRNAIDALIARVRRDPDECWIVPLRNGGEALPHVWLDRLTSGAARRSYERFVGPVPDGLVVDHVWSRGCRSRRCVNPWHLEAVSRSENAKRGTPGLYRGPVLAVMAV